VSPVPTDALSRATRINRNSCQWQRQVAGESTNTPVGGLSICLRPSIHLRDGHCRGAGRLPSRPHSANRAAGAHGNCEADIEANATAFYCAKTLLDILEEPATLPALFPMSTPRERFSSLITKVHARAIDEPPEPASLRDIEQSGPEGIRDGLRAMSARCVVEKTSMTERSTEVTGIPLMQADLLGCEVRPDESRSIRVLPPQPSRHRNSEVNTRWVHVRDAVEQQGRFMRQGDALRSLTCLRPQDSFAVLGKPVCRKVRDPVNPSAHSLQPATLREPNQHRVFGFPRRVRPWTQAGPSCSSASAYSSSMRVRGIKRLCSHNTHMSI